MCGGFNWFELRVRVGSGGSCGVRSMVRKDDTVVIDAPVVSPRVYDEPVVTRKELWSYYSKSCSSLRFPGSQPVAIPSVLQWRQCALILVLSVWVAIENLMRVGCWSQR